MATMAVSSPMIDSKLDVDKLTYEIFSILEEKFLFGNYDDSPKLFLSSAKSGATSPVDETLASDLKPNNNNKNNKNKNNKSNVTGKVRILSIDGGGSTDGILAGRSLAHLEECLRMKSGNPDARISDFFDVAAGSGVGGVLASLLFTRGKDGRPMFKADEALKFLVNNRRKLNNSGASSNGIFRRMFRSTKSERIFRKVFGESMTLKDTLKPVLIPCYDLATRAPFLFSRADALETDGYDFTMRDVCIATLADPTVVGAVEMRSVDKRTRIVAVDGGVAMNNPTAAAITHVLNNRQEFPFCDGVEDLLVVSLGNAETGSGGRRDPMMSPAGFMKIAGEGASDMVDQAVSMAFGEFMPNNYVRIQANGFNITRNSSCSSSDNGKNLLRIAEEMLKQKNVESVLFRGKKIVEKTNSEKLELFAGELIKEHERRKSSILPVVMFKQASPRNSSATVSTVSSY